MKYLFCFFLFFYAVSPLFSTCQIPDQIIYKGKKYPLHEDYMMEAYFDKHPQKRPKGTYSTGLHRGYVATFEVILNEIYCVNIESQVIGKGEWESIFEQVFPQQKRVKITWETDLIQVSTGKKMPNTSCEMPEFSEYLLLEVYQGAIKKTKIVQHYYFEFFKWRQLEYFKQKEGKEYELRRKEWTTELKEYSGKEPRPTFVDAMIQERIFEYSKLLAD